MMIDYDVMIVGAGPAGSTLAQRLQQQGRQVLMLDKAVFPRNKVCAGWVTPEILQSLAFDQQAYRDSGRLLQPIHGFRVGLMGQAGVAWRQENEPVSYGIRRYEFDDYLQQQVQADKQLGTKVKTIQRQDGLWCINQQWQAPLLVGAGGHFCPVARRLSEGPGGHELVVAAKELEVELTPEEAEACRVAEDTPELWFCDDLKGYGWIFRKGRYINIGLGREDNHQLSAHLEAFVKDREQQGSIPVIDGRYQGHAYLLYDHARRPLVADGVLLVGDAAGLAYTQSGEGIRPAIESALLAAASLKGLDDYRCERLAGYEQQMMHRFGARKAGDLPPANLPRWKKALARPLMRSRWFTRQVVAKRWFLHQHVPALSIS